MDSSAPLTTKQAKFVSSYILTGNAVESAKLAGFSEKNLAPQASRLLRNPKIVAELDLWKAKKANELTKEDFVDLALGDYRALDLREPNKPRFLDIAGKALGYLGVVKAEQQTNNTQININVESMTVNDRWEYIRKALDNGQ